MALLATTVAFTSVECTQPEKLQHHQTGAAGAGTPGAAGATGLAGDMGAAGAGVAGAGDAGAGVAGAGDAGAGVAGAGVAGAGVAGAGVAGAGVAGAGVAGAGAAGAGVAGAGVAGAGAAGAGAAGAGAAGAGAAGAGAAGAGAAGNGVCMNSTVVTAGGSEATCGAKTGWKATAMPTPPSMYLNIPDSQLQPQYAIDGNTATRYSSGATIASGFYFQVDLGAAKMVSGITVDTSEGADTMDVANGYDVGLSTDGTTFTTISTCPYGAAPKEVINFKATSARYVRYTNKGAPGPKNGPTSWMSIHEFDILCN